MNIRRLMTACVLPLLACGVVIPGPAFGDGSPPAGAFSAAAALPEAPDILAPPAFFETTRLPLALIPRGSVPASGYEVAVGTTAGGTQASAFKPTGLREQILLTGLDLVSGTIYYVTARGLSLDGAAGPAGPSVPVLIDASRPPRSWVAPAWNETQGRYTGLALLNTATTAAAALIRGYPDGGGAPVTGSWVLAPGSQGARVISEEEVLGKAVAGKTGWFEVLHLEDGLQMMYLVGDAQASRFLAGSRLLEGGSGWIVPELDAGRAVLDLVNNSTQPATLKFTLYSPRTAPEQKEVVVPGLGSLSQRANELFATHGWLDVTGVAPYISIEADNPVVCSSLLRREGDATRVPCLSETGLVREGAFPYVVHGVGYKTRLVLVNPTAEPQFVSIRLASPENILPILLSMPPRTALSEDLDRLFFLGDAGAAPGVRGTVRISAPGGSGITGSAWIYTAEFGALASLGLDGLTATEAIFPHVAQSQGYWTGVSISNPGSAAIEVRVDALTRDGLGIGTYTRTLQPDEIHVGLLYEWIPATLGQLTGRVQIRSAAPFLAVQIFGTDSLSAMETVPR